MRLLFLLSRLFGKKSTPREGSRISQDKILKSSIFPAVERRASPQPNRHSALHEVRRHRLDRAPFRFTRRISQLVLSAHAAMHNARSA